MRRIINYMVVFVTALSVLMSGEGLLDVWAANLQADSNAQKEDVLQFAKYMYELALGRRYEVSDGIAWIEAMALLDLDCAAITGRIFRSNDFAELNLSNREYIERLYLAILSVISEPEEEQNWLNTMKMGHDRNFVLQKFVNSEYFTILTDGFSLERGALHKDGRAVNIGVCRFINRLYRVVLERKFDTWGYCTWALIISDRGNTLEELARAFFDTEMYISMNTSDEAYVEDLYLVFFDRIPQNAEVEAWVEALKAGATRYEVLLCFSRSGEFGSLLESYDQPAPLEPLE